MKWEDRMPQIRDLLKHVSVEAAERRRKCHRNSRKHSIQKGHTCLVIRDDTTNQSKNYCMECAAAILEKAQTRLDELTKQIGFG